MTSTNLLSQTSLVVVIICVVAIFRVSSLEVYTLHIWDILIIIKTLFLRPYPVHSVAAHGKVAPNKLHWNTSNKHVLLLEASQQHGGRYERRLVHATQAGDGHVPHSGLLQVPNRWLQTLSHRHRAGPLRILEAGQQLDPVGRNDYKEYSGVFVQYTVSD